jgi:hypothetical protein
MLVSVVWYTNLAGIFSREIPPLEYTKELFAVVSNKTKFEGEASPNPLAALEIAEAAVTTAEVVFTFCATLAVKETLE